LISAERVLALACARLAWAESRVASAWSRVDFEAKSRLARSAFLAFSPGQNSQATYENELADIRQRVEYLTDELNRLAAVVAVLAPAAAP
jgi:hypothetical protein